MKSAALREIPEAPKPLALVNLADLRRREAALVEQVVAMRAALEARDTALVAHATEMANSPRGAQPFDATDEAGRLAQERDTARAAVEAAEAALRQVRAELAPFVDLQRIARRVEQVDRFKGPAREMFGRSIDRVQAATQELRDALRACEDGYVAWAGELGHPNLAFIGDTGAVPNLKKQLSDFIGGDLFGRVDPAALSFRLGNGAAGSPHERWRDRVASGLGSVLQNVENLE